MVGEGGIILFQNVVGHHLQGLNSDHSVEKTIVYQAKGGSIRENVKLEMEIDFYSTDKIHILICIVLTKTVFLQSKSGIIKAKYLI